MEKKTVKKSVFAHSHMEGLFVLEFQDHFGFDGHMKRGRMRITGEPYKEDDTWIVPVEIVDLV